MTDVLSSSIPTRRQLREISESREGSLANVPFTILLLALAVAKRDVVLHLRRTPLEKSIAFDDGAPVECRSNVATETLGRFMMSTGKLSQNDFQTSLSQSAARGVPLEDILIERGLSNPSDIYRILQQNLARKLLDVFTWRTGDFRISGDVPPVESPLRVKVPQLILTGIVKYGSQSDIDAAVASLNGKMLAVHPEPLFPREEIRLSSEQQLLNDTLRTPRNAVDLIKQTGLAPEEGNRHLYALMFLGVIADAEGVPAKPRPKFELSILEPTPASSPVALAPLAMAAPAPASASAVAERRDGNRDELMRVFLAYRRKDAFDLLGLPEEATISIIVRSYLTFADRFHPSRFRVEPPESLREKAEEVFLAGARAYAELADADRRKALIERRSRRTQSKDQAVDPLSVRSGLVDPELLYRKGKEYSDAGRYREALPYFEKAADCDAQNEVYAAELTYCRFHLLISTATQALTALKETLRTNSSCGVAWFFAGKIHAAIGNRDEAEAYFRRAATLMKNDPRPLEALKAFPKKF
ncbi:MAG TPA: DUF4388 domain-containing protein [Thermoanaerobaculia bacterium]|nr:DUF4388 domain-containing protein [Thermoanaerobaculia bacterium]